MPTQRQLRWFQTHADAQNVTSGGQSANQLLSALTVDQRKGATITRILMHLVLEAQAIDTSGLVKYGICSMSEDAVTASAFPDADAALDLTDWLIRGAAVIRMSDTDDGAQLVRIEKDFRAQRVLRGATDETHFIIDQNTSGMSIVYHLYTRILVRLP